MAIGHSDACVPISVGWRRGDRSRPSLQIHASVDHAESLMSLAGDDDDVHQPGHCRRGKQGGPFKTTTVVFDRAGEAPRSIDVDHLIVQFDWDKLGLVQSMQGIVTF
ncbi:hypothetical protein E2562_029713 [Oryza meyeriana var. granulata]|uniref:Uncharacterized protein n=1 Tax=Oryza meyeriana var. granulata TaxID=110450 RepID=A0A6G1C0Q1_9ORYZ|nr:hypothetical protein E2562_029713 [Oryza meyeriana var. granulata]